MNEFIVWSEIGQRFLEIYEFAVNAEGKIVLLKNGNIFDVVKSSQEYILCIDIGKTDDTPEQNKIYADCSIVEFTYTDADPKNTERMTGFFTYNISKLGYVLCTTLDRDGWFKEINHLKDFKVIGTLQENNELIKRER